MTTLPPSPGGYGVRVCGPCEAKRSALRTFNNLSVSCAFRNEEGVRMPCDANGGKGTRKVRRSKAKADF